MNDRTFELYDRLGVKPSATQGELKAAYRSKARTMHPDLGGDPREFDLLKKSYDVLSDPERRRVYDETGEIRQKVPDNTDAAVMGEISKYLALMLGEETVDPCSLDMVKEITILLRKEIDGNEDAARKSRLALSRIDRILKQNMFRPREVDAHNSFTGMMEWHRAQAEAHLKLVAEKNARLQRSIEFLQGYRFDQGFDLIAAARATQGMSQAQYASATGTTYRGSFWGGGNGGF